MNYFSFAKNEIFEKTKYIKTFFMNEGAIKQTLIKA
jgi:hypothetical protein